MYILKCCDDSYYTGSTWDLERRVIQHQEGLGARHTAKRLPVELVYAEEYDRIDDAFQRERQIHRWTRRKKEALIVGSETQLPELAKKVFRLPQT
ncbi:MAG: GIY-YIG nuclease family protein [Fibrobacteres bacterium]|jgi:putative endonuclease|nr:GIY-YIG nuclease family protein [Fibrobacterota bacterium]